MWEPAIRQYSRVPSGGLDRERWHFGGRYYALTLASTPETLDLELDDIGPDAGLGRVLIASTDGETGMTTLRCFTDAPLPVELLEAFLDEARRTLPPNA